MAQFVGFHGLGCSKESFDPMADILRSQGHDFFAFNYKGFGDRVLASPSNDDPFGEAVAEALKHTKDMENIHVIAHSMGAVIALQLAEQISHKIAQMVVIEGNLCEHDGRILSRNLNDAPDNNAITTIKKDLIRNNTASPSPGLRYWAKAIENVTPQTLKTYATALVDVSDSGRMMGIFREGLKCRKLYIHGDQYLRHKTLDMMRNIISVTHIPEAGHFSIIDDPKSCVDAILENAGLSSVHSYTQPYTPQPSGPYKQPTR